MKVTISIKCRVNAEDNQKLLALRSVFNAVCNYISPIAHTEKCYNRVALHNKVYTDCRLKFPLGSQMVCNAIFSVCKAYKASNRKRQENKIVQFKASNSVHFDKRTYTLSANTLSLYTLEGRIQVNMQMGLFQKQYFEKGAPLEAELICKKGKWYFNLVLEIQEVKVQEDSKYFACDLGENNIIAMTSGKVISGGKIRHDRDRFLARRAKLQSNGSKSAKRLLKKISGKEAFRMKQENHKISKLVIKEAIKHGANTIVLENLTNIRDRIRSKKRERTRLHRWSFNQLGEQIHYKGSLSGLKVVYVNPAYSSKLCLNCGSLGSRHKNTFTCRCGNKQHSDLYACQKLCVFAQSADCAMAAVNQPKVASF